MGFGASGGYRPSAPKSSITTARMMPGRAAAGEKARREKIYVKAIGIWYEREQRTGWAGTAAASLLQPRFKSYYIGSNPADERSDQWRLGGVR